MRSTERDLEYNENEVRIESHGTVRLGTCLTRVRDEAIMVEIAVPGERWEVEFFGDGRVEVEVFKSPGITGGEEELARLLEDFGE